MASQGKEIELKLRVPDREGLLNRMDEVGALFVSKKIQEDELFESPVVHFAELNQALRLRTEMGKDGEFAVLAFKGTPSFTSDGHSVRDEFETVVEPEAMRKILLALGFTPGLVVEKERTSYHLDGVMIEIDDLVFGSFVELEGLSETIEVVRQKLGLTDALPVKEGYGDLQQAWERAKA